MSVKLGIAPIAWSNDDMPELGGDTPLDQCLSEASEAGFSGIESGGKFPKISKELIPLLEKYFHYFSFSVIFKQKICIRKNIPFQ